MLVFQSFWKSGHFAAWCDLMLIIILHIDIDHTCMFLVFVCTQGSTSRSILQHCAMHNCVTWRGGLSIHISTVMRQCCSAHQMLGALLGQKVFWHSASWTWIVIFAQHYNVIYDIPPVGSVSFVSLYDSSVLTAFWGKICLVVCKVAALLRLCKKLLKCISL